MRENESLNKRLNRQREKVQRLLDRTWELAESTDLAEVSDEVHQYRFARGAVDIVDLLEQSADSLEQVLEWFDLVFNGIEAREKQ